MRQDATEAPPRTWVAVEEIARRAGASPGRPPRPVEPGSADALAAPTRLLAGEATSAPRRAAGRGVRLASLARRIAAAVAVIRLRLAHRREMRDLALRQPDSVLHDAGVSREEARAIARRPLWLD